MKLATLFTLMALLAVAGSMPQAHAFSWPTSIAVGAVLGGGLTWLISHNIPAATMGFCFITLLTYGLESQNNYRTSAEAVRQMVPVL